MNEIFERIKLIFSGAQKASHKIKRKTRAQSMVEFAITLPILIALLLGMVEFGFMLNTYLSLLDATRYAARKYGNTTPLKTNLITNTIYYDEDFDDSVVTAVKDNLAPPDDLLARQIVLDPTLDDILVSVISIDVNKSTDPDTISSITRITTDAGIPVPFTSYSGKFASLGGTHYEDDDITNFMSNNGAQPVSTGLLIVELYYSYEGTLNISTRFMELFAEDNHIMLYTSTIMPLVSVRPPDPTPTP